MTDSSGMNGLRFSSPIVGRSAGNKNRIQTFCQSLMINQHDYDQVMNNPVPGSPANLSDL
jgi:hypothetical protein